MSNAMANHKETLVARPLHVLVPLIKEDLEHGDEAGIPYYREAGKKLIEARSQVPHGKWQAWLADNFNRSVDQARIYIGLAKDAIATSDTQKPAAPRFSSLEDYKRSKGRNRPTSGRVYRDYQPEIDQVINKIDVATLNLQQEALKRAEEREAERQLGLQLVDIGFKALATKLHPDKGGSKEAMIRLTRVRDRFKSFA